MAPNGDDLNIEQVFVALRRAWHPPSAAIETSFTTHTRTLSRIFAAMRADEDLAFLHSQIYRELPGASAGTGRPARADGAAAGKVEPADDEATRRRQFRKGFYLCNSLIQLMEDVYLGLRLAHEYSHPDNRGWMNLFRHWARSNMFRQTWAVSACTYGLRFQDFCSRHLQLEVGWTELHSVWDRGVDAEGELGEKARRKLEVAEVQMVHHLLRPNVRGIANSISRRIHKVVAGRLVVPSAEMVERIGITGRALSFEERQELDPLTYGVAVLDHDGCLLSVRVRRHLRSRGLGRQLIRGLISRLGVRDTALPSVSELGRIGLAPRSLERVDNLFKSVLNEFDLERARLATGTGRAVTNPVLGPLAELPYSGVIRPLDATWAHALGLFYWWVAWRPDLDLDSKEIDALGRSLRGWLGIRVDSDETGVLARESLRWLLDSRHLEQALADDLDRVLAELCRQPWFEPARRLAFAGDLVRIARAEGGISGREEWVVLHIVEQLELSDKQLAKLGLSTGRRGAAGGRKDPPPPPAPDDR